jgi:hypothetical protein
MEEIPWGVAVHRPQFALGNSDHQRKSPRFGNFVVFDVTRPSGFFHYIGN